MRSKLLIAVLGVAAAAWAQQNKLNQRSTMHITLPDDSPLAVLSADWGESVATPRGSAMLLDLRTSLTLRNVSTKRVRGVTLLVLAQEVAPGGKASVSVPSLDVGPGEAFPVRLDLRLLRPQLNSNGPLVEISLDGVLFEDLAFYGPNRLQSRRTMTTWELEARRDRRYLKHMYESAGVDTLRLHLTSVQARLSERPKVDVQVARGRSTAQEPDRRMRFAFLDIPGSPVSAVGTASIQASEAGAPDIQVRNTGIHPVRYVEIGWLVKSRTGEDIFAGTFPADVNLAPSMTGRIQQDATIRLSQRNGQPMPISSLTGFVHHVEFADGSTWIPQRDALESSGLAKSMQPSPEEQRLSDLYRRRGIQSVIDELRKR